MSKNRSRAQRRWKVRALRRALRKLEEMMNG